MIIFVIALLTVLTFWAFMYLKHPVNTILGIFFMLLLLGATWLTTLNFHDHWGMEKVTKTETNPIYTAGETSSPAGMLLTQQIGKKSGNYVLVFRDTKDAKKATAHYAPDTKHIVNAVKKAATYRYADVNKATVTTKTTRWVWSNDFAKSLFGFTGMAGDLVKQSNQVTIPKDTWVAMTPAQAKAMAASQAAANKDPKKAQALAAQQTAMKTTIQKKVMAYAQAHPGKDLTAYTNTVTAEETAKMIKAMIK